MYYDTDVLVITLWIMLGKGLKFVTVNIRSLYPSIDEVRCKFKDFDIIGICETWLNSSYTDNLIDIESFSLYIIDRESGNILNIANQKKKGGGLAMYIGSKFKGHCEQIYDCSKITKDLEQLWVLLEKPNVRKIATCILYKPPTGDVETALKELTVSIEFIQSVHDVEFVIMGDMNVNYRDRHSKCFEFLKEFERAQNLKQMISEPTRITVRSKSTIDLIWTNMAHVSNSGTLNRILSDHMPVYIIKKKERERTEFKYCNGRSYKNYVKHDFIEDIRNHYKWRDYWLCTKNPENLWEIMETIILECAEYHCPQKRMKFRDNSPSWISKEIVEELYYKDDLYKYACITGKECDWNIFRVQNKRVKKLILEAKEEYTKDLLEQTDGNPRKFWRCINEISGLGKSKNKKGVTKLIDDFGNEYRNMEAAEYMNEYYTDAGPQLAQKMKTPWYPNDCLKNITTSFSFEFVTESLVRKLVSEIKISKSSALDNLSSRLLKDAFSTLIFELTYLYNTCIETSIFPRAWSVGKISPIPKVNNSNTKVKDWRPITQIPLPGKLLERILHNQMYSYLEFNNLLCKNQYGFRRELSTSQAIFDVLKIMYEKWNDRMCTGCIFVDFSKAFETINHSILVEKLKMYGFDQRSLKLMENYITTRTQVIMVNGHVSTPKIVTCGTAQGSILGPLIYILYVNDVLNLLDHENDMFLYADDMLIMSHRVNVEVMLQDLQGKMDKIYKWCQLNKLTINEAKTKYMIIGHTPVEPIRRITLNAKTLGKVTQYEYLGMVLEHKLSMDRQIESMYKKATKKLGILSKIRMFISCKTSARIYKTMIRPHLEYVDFIVESGSKKLVSKVDRIQERALRKIEYCKNPENRKEYSVLEKEYNIENLSTRRKRSLLRYMFHQSKDELNQEKRKSDRILRSNKKVKLKCDFSNLTKLHNSPFYRGTKAWNDLPYEIQTCEQKDVFKNMVKKLIV